MIVQRASKRSTLFGIGFLLLQLVVVAVAIAATSRELHKLEARFDLPPMRNVPLTVSPLYDRPRVVSDEQLQMALHKLRPRLRGEKPKINHIDHALRFWGLDATFDDPECLAGMEMREVLVNHNRFAKEWGADQPPLLMAKADGIRVRTREGFATASHVDHTLAGLAEIGTPLDFPIQTANASLTARALLEQSLRDFSLNQIEYEWSALAYALYVIPVENWYSKEGQRITFDRLADRIMRQKLNQGVCMGNHRLHALVMMLRVDEQTPILSAEGRARIIDHLTDATGRYVRSQHPDGFWLRTWPSGEPPELGTADDTPAYRIMATGHVLEWWALAPEEVLPPRETIVRAGQWLCRTIENMDDIEIKEGYTYLTHAGRALALWRGHFPAYFLHKFNMDGEELQHRDGQQRSGHSAD
jgi:hypothetical protein